MTARRVKVRGIRDIFDYINDKQMGEELFELLHEVVESMSSGQFHAIRFHSSEHSSEKILEVKSLLDRLNELPLHWVYHDGESRFDYPLVQYEAHGLGMGSENWIDVIAPHPYLHWLSFNYFGNKNKVMGFRYRDFLEMRERWLPEEWNDRNETNVSPKILLSSRGEIQ